MELDLTYHDAPELLINTVIEKYGIPDILINNAAYSTNNDFSNLTADELDKHYKVNVRATALLSSQFGQKFNKKSGDYRNPSESRVRSVVKMPSLVLHLLNVRHFCL